MALLPLDVPAGFLRVDSLNAGQGRYTGGDHVLFLNGRPEKWPGWELFLATALQGIARGATSWVNQYGNTNAMIGTHLKLYSITGDDTLTDRTPIRATSTINANPFSMTSGSAVVTVTDTAHGADDGAFVTFSGAVAVPGNDAATKALLHCDGADAGTTFTDSNVGGSAHTWTAAGNAQIDTAQQKFGTASGLFDGTGDLVSTPDHADYTLGSSAFTVDAWVRPNADGSLLYCCGQAHTTLADSNSAWYFARTAGNKITFNVVEGTTVTTVTGTSNVIAGAWYHIAGVRTGNTLKLFINGTQEGGDVSFSGTINNSTAVLAIGAAGAFASDLWNGWIDEFRLSVGIARWTTTFTPPTVAYGSETTTLNAEYQLTYIDANSYTITLASAATATVAGGGAAVTAAYQINPGTGSGVQGLGWGAGTWGTGTWSTPRAEGIPLELRYWSVHEYGNDVLASPSGGSLYLWEEATDARAELVTNAPASIRFMFVTPERFVFALGAGSDATTPMTVKWPDQDDITAWTPTAANTANSRTLQAGSKLVGGCALSDGISLVWSDTALYVFQYTGSEFIYDSRLAGTHCGLLAPGAFVKVSGLAYWMSGHAFHAYAGGVAPIPRSSDIEDYVFRDLDKDNATKTWGQYIQASNQVRWHYVSHDSSNGEPDKYVDVCLDDYSWTTGTFDATTGTPYRPSESSSLFVTAAGAIHEFGVGSNANAAALSASLTWGLFVLARGEQNVDVMGLVPDCARQTGDLAFTVSTYDRPNSASAFDSGATTLDEDDEIADLRVSGRHFTMSMLSNEVGGDFRLGIVALEVQNAGERR